MIRLGPVLSQGEIDGLLQSMLEDSSVLPTDSRVSEAPPPGKSAAAMISAMPSFAPPSAPATTGDAPTGIAAFKAKLEAAKAARENADDSN